MAGPTMLLVHSPLVGPSSWRPFAETARERGYDVLRPDLTGVADAPSPQWRHFVDVAESSALGHDDVIIVGHSGAGAMLRAIAERIGSHLRAVVFVDAVVPPPEEAHTTSTELLELLESKAVDGVLAPWLDWYPTDVVDELIPDPTDQDALRSDMPRLQKAFFDDAIPVRPGWTGWPCAYVKLSDAYDAEYAGVAKAGWPRATIAGTHLSIFTDPAAVLDAVENLTAQLGDK